VSPDKPEPVPVEQPPLAKMKKSGRSNFQRFRRRFPILVFGTLLVFFIIEHSRPSRSELPVFVPTEEVELNPLEIPRGELMLAGTVLDASGAPASQVLVEFTQREEPHWIYTDADGKFELDGLFEGEVRVTLVQLNTPPARFDVTLPCEPVTWSLAREYTSPGSLPESRRSALFGRVTSPIGTPVDDCQLILQPTDENPALSVAVLRRVPLGNGGVFAIADLALGNYRAYVLPGWAKGGTWPRLVALDYEHVASAPDLNLVLDSGELEGTLRLAGGAAPLVGAQVLLWNAEHPGQVWEPVVTDEAGYFRIVDLPRGQYIVEVRAGGLRQKEFVTIAPKTRVKVDFGEIELSE